MAIISNPEFVFPQPHQPCICASGRTFSECCGSPSESRQIPCGVFLFSGLLSEIACKRLVSIAESNSHSRLTTMILDEATGEKISVPDEHRVTNGVDLSRDNDFVDQLVCDIWYQCVQKEVNCQIEWFEQPTLLSYEKGGHYGRHADAENYDASTGMWKRSLDRDLSMLAYANDDFEGGAVHFPNFSYRYHPRKGDVLVFPSDHRYLHEAELVTQGVRYAVVSWAGVKGCQRSYDSIPENAIQLAP